MSGSGRDGDPFAAGAAEAARLTREVQDLGFVAARSVVERFVALCAQFTAGPADAEAPRRDGDGLPPFWPWGSDASLRQLQSDMARATDAYLAVLTQLNEASLRYLDAASWREPAASERDEVLLPLVAPGGRSSARLWLHNTTSAGALDLRPWCPGLATHSGTTIPTTAVTCQPARIDRLEAGASHELVVTVAVGEEDRPGVYHGQLLVDGLPDVVLPIRVRVLTETDR